MSSSDTAGGAHLRRRCAGTGSVVDVDRAACSLQQGPRRVHGRDGQVPLPRNVVPSQPQYSTRSRVQGRAGPQVQGVPQPCGPWHSSPAAQSLRLVQVRLPAGSEVAVPEVAGGGVGVSGVPDATGSGAVLLAVGTTTVVSGGVGVGAGAHATSAVAVRKARAKTW